MFEFLKLSCEDSEKLREDKARAAEQEYASFQEQKPEIGTVRSVLRHVRLESESRLVGSVCIETYTYPRRSYEIGPRWETVATIPCICEVGGLPIETALSCLKISANQKVMEVLSNPKCEYEL